jgi:tetratricopeptide (TPR) repeat protein
MSRLCSSLVLGFVMVALAGSASAEKPLSKSAKERAAKKACAMGDFQKGADILTDLFIDTNDTTYVYNQGRCYQQNNRFEQAISRFREYLRKAKDLSDSDRAETERQIADCEESLGKVAQVAPPPAATPPPASVTHVETPSPTSEAATPEVSTKPGSLTSDGSQGKGLRVAGIICAAVGVAAIGTGVALALKSQSLSTKDYSQARENERSSLKTWGWVGYGVGGAALATGAILYIVGWPHESGAQTSSVALLPIVAPDGASMLLQGRF